MKQLVVGISDCKVAVDADAVLVTYALGSCIAVTVYDPVAKVGGMLHYMLPEASLDLVKARQNPYMFADTGIPQLFETVRASGGEKRRLVVRLTGGAQVLDGQGIFQIGKRNYLAAKRILWKAGILISAEAVGGEISRTIRLEIGTGRMWLREGGGAEKELNKRPAGVNNIASREPGNAILSLDRG